nr:MAG TPA: hypothetical protein [Caudoviricetes sp.]
MLFNTQYVLTLFTFCDILLLQFLVKRLYPFWINLLQKSEKVL